MPIIDEFILDGPAEVPTKSPLELQGEALRLAFQDRRFVKFQIPERILLYEPEVAVALQREMFILDAKFNYVTQSFDYLACSPLLMPLPAGCEAPNAHLLLVRESCLDGAWPPPGSRSSRVIRVELTGPTASVVIELDP